MLLCIFSIFLLFSYCIYYAILNNTTTTTTTTICILLLLLLLLLLLSLLLSLLPPLQLRLQLTLLRLLPLYFLYRVEESLRSLHTSNYLHVELHRSGLRAHATLPVLLLVLPHDTLPTLALQQHLTACTNETGAVYSY